MLFNHGSYGSSSCLLYTLVMAISIFLFMLFLPIANSLSFNFTTFDPNMADISFQGDAFTSNNVLQLTKNEKVDDNDNFRYSVGRASYKHPVRLWDAKTRRLTDFTAHFSFIMKRIHDKYQSGDGMSFFIAPVDSQIPDNSSGGFLALFNNDTALNASKENQIIAVEFDSFKNAWDPDDNHVGILVNSIISVTNVTWNSSITNGHRLMHGVGFSASTGMSVELHNIISWDFDSSLEINQKARHKTGLLVCISVGLVIFACAVIGVFWLVFWRKRHGGRNEDEADDVSMDDEFEKGTGPKRFTFAELSRATSNFAESGKLGEGGFGGVYKGLLSESNTQIAVKKFSRGSKQGKKEYVSEVKIITRLRHRNLVQLTGWCHERGEFLLVYEFLPNGSLDSHLFGGETMLIWSVRYKIAFGLASALLYLHEEWEQCVVHRDIKSSNVMLDSNFNAKLGDFGLARLVDHELGSQTTVLAGTMGYLAPECVTTGKASKESDVYGFGVVALEITSGRRPVDTTQEPNKVRLVEWVWDLISHPDFAHRPSIRQVISVLNFEAPLPSLPAKLPVPIYYAPPMNLREFSSTSSGLTTSESSGTTNSSLLAPRSTKPLLNEEEPNSQYEELNAKLENLRMEMQRMLKGKAVVVVVVNTVHTPSGLSILNTPDFAGNLNPKLFCYAGMGLRSSRLLVVLPSSAFPLIAPLATPPSPLKKKGEYFNEKGCESKVGQCAKGTLLIGNEVYCHPKHRSSYYETIHERRGFQILDKSQLRRRRFQPEIEENRVSSQATSQKGKSYMAPEDPFAKSKGAGSKGATIHSALGLDVD
ncbi:hypothetical protein GH714_042362 [Hevea brasiliensis]|uniref:non-specific serine/threonine protein kinase n=1 Tax=Hevea brasiliensis TaxID=3981 RepID=A0A6A6K8Y7_HEVBR|nr:hypothetical protein GH714_042362 [Hevea brasiliensis]